MLHIPRLAVVPDRRMGPCDDERTEREDGVFVRPDVASAHQDVASHPRGLGMIEEPRRDVQRRDWRESRRKLDPSAQCDDEMHNMEAAVKVEPSVQYGATIPNDGNVDASAINVDQGAAVG